MGTVGLFFVGSVLLINGLTLLGVVRPKSAAGLNILIGMLLLGVTGQAILPVHSLSAPEDFERVITATGFLLFGITYLYVAYSNLTGVPGCALGWYCGWASLVSAGLFALNLLRNGDVKSAMQWGLWTLLFAAFFALGALGANRLTRATGWMTVAQSFVTCTVPGALMMLGLWNSLPNWVALTATAGTAALFLVLALVPPASPVHAEPAHG